MIATDLECKLNHIQQSLPRLIKVSTPDSLPLGMKIPFLKVSGEDGKSVFIRKITAVWLFQEVERVSSDRLFRVRNKQPYSSFIKKPKSTIDGTESTR